MELLLESLDTTPYPITERIKGTGYKFYYMFSDELHTYRLKLSKATEYGKNVYVMELGQKPASVAYYKKIVQPFKDPMAVISTIIEILKETTHMQTKIQGIVLEIPDKKFGRYTTLINTIIRTKLRESFALSTVSIDDPMYTELGLNAHLLVRRPYRFEDVFNGDIFSKYDPAKLDAADAAALAVVEVKRTKYTPPSSIRFVQDAVKESGKKATAPSSIAPNFVNRAALYTKPPELSMPTVTIPRDPIPEGSYKPLDVEDAVELAPSHVSAIHLGEPYRYYDLQGPDVDGSDIRNAFFTVEAARILIRTEALDYAAKNTKPMRTEKVPPYEDIESRLLEVLGLDYENMVRKAEIYKIVHKFENKNVNPEMFLNLTLDEIKEYIEKAGVVPIIPWNFMGAGSRAANGADGYFKEIVKSINGTGLNNTLIGLFEQCGYTIGSMNKWLETIYGKGLEKAVVKFVKGNNNSGKMVANGARTEFLNDKGARVDTTFNITADYLLTEKIKENPGIKVEEIQKIMNQLHPVLLATSASTALFVDNYEIWKANFFETWVRQGGLAAQQFAYLAFPHLNNPDNREFWTFERSFLSEVDFSNAKDTFIGRFYDQIWQETQDYYAMTLDKKLKLHRGIGIVGEPKKYVPAVVESWTSAPTVAKLFADMMTRTRDATPRLFEMTVTYRQIWASYKSLGRWFTDESALAGKKEFIPAFSVIDLDSIVQVK